MLFAFMSASDKQIRMINDYVPSLCLLATYVNQKGHVSDSGTIFCGRLATFVRKTCRFIYSITISKVELVS